MPLQLNSPDPAMDLRKRIVWNPDSVEDVLEAQSKIDKLRGQGFTTNTSTPGEMVLDPPERDNDGTVLVRVLDDSGDSRLVWNRHNIGEIEDARAKFDEYINKGYRAYVCRSDGSKGRKVDTFDALMEELIMVEDEIKEQQIDAIPAGAPPAPLPPKKQPEAVMVPPTHPS